MLLLCSMSFADFDSSRIDILSLWNFNDPAGTREAFERVLAADAPEADTAMRLAIKTQIARTYGLEGKFDTAHAILDEVAAHDLTAMPVVRVRYLLERGRTLRSSGKATEARPLFVEAWDVGREAGADYLAIDAAHMVALVADSVSERRMWSIRGLELAETSADTRCRHWIGSIGNNLGWDFHEAGEFDSALVWFQKALEVRLEEGKEDQTNIARWCIGRCYRSLGRFDDAMRIQADLRDKHAQANTPDGYVFEELAELYLIREDTSNAKVNFAEAHRLLSQDRWFIENEGARLKRMAELAETR